MNNYRFTQNGQIIEQCNENIVGSDPVAATWISDFSHDLYEVQANSEL